MPELPTAPTAAPDRTAWDARATTLTRMPKATLLTVWRFGAGRNVVWTAHPVSQWSKDEIVSDILRHEYPQAVSS